MSKRKYATRTKSTSRKTYEEYLLMREEQLSKGIQLKEAMSKQSYAMYYNRIANAKKAGEIKSSPWQYIKSKERLLSSKQAKVFAKALTEKRLEEANKFALVGNFKKATVSEVYRLGTAEIQAIGAYINKTKETGLYGGDYE